jgi:hypothetical protein
MSFMNANFAKGIRVFLSEILISRMAFAHFTQKHWLCQGHSHIPPRNTDFAKGIRAFQSGNTDFACISPRSHPDFVVCVFWKSPSTLPKKKRAGIQTCHKYGFAQGIRTFQSEIQILLRAFSHFTQKHEFCLGRSRISLRDTDFAKGLRAFHPEAKIVPRTIAYFNQKY